MPLLMRILKKSALLIAVALLSLTFTLPVRAALLPAPSWVAVTNDSWNRFKVEWPAVAGATGYWVQRKADDATSFETVANLQATQNSLSDTVTNGHLYRYRVQAIGGSEPGLSRDAAPAAMLYPVGIGLLAAAPDKIEVSWTLPPNPWLPDNGFTPYVERRKLGEGWQFAGKGMTGAASFTDTGLAEGWKYEYRVRLDVGLSGTLLWWPPADGQVVFTKLRAPEKISATLTSYGTVDLRWESTVTMAAYSQIERSTDGGEYLLLSTVAAGTPTFSDTTAVNGHIYRYRVRHMGAGAVGDWSTEARIVFLYPNRFTTDAVYPDQINLAWTWPAVDPAALGEAKPRIERRKTGESVWTLVALLDAGATEYRDQGLKPDTVYNYRIQTQYPDGSFSPWFPPYGQAQEVRTGIAFSTGFFGHALSGTMVQLEWDFDALDGKTIILERYDEADVPVSLLQSASERSFIDTNCLPGNEYTYRLTVRAPSGLSTISSEPLVIKTEAVPTPANVVATPAAADRMVITWNYDFTRESGFEIWRKTTGTWERVGETNRNIQYFTDTGLPAKGPVQWKIRAVRGDQVFSAFAETESRLLDVPALPTEMDALLHLGRLKIKWSAPLPDFGLFVTYHLESRSQLNLSWQAVMDLLPGSTEADWFLMLAGSQEFRIRADVKDLPVYSATYRYPGKKPASPSGFKTEMIGSGRVLLQWDAPEEAVSGYRIYRLDVKPKQLIGTAAGDATSFTDLSVTAGSKAQYSIVAWNAMTTANEVVLKPVTVPTTAAFNDLGSAAWAAPAIRRLYAKGIVAGTSKTTFSPGKMLTRAEYVKMVYAALGLEKADRPSAPLSDIPKEAWYAGWMYAAFTDGLLQPDKANRLYPQAVITRGEVAMLTHGACLTAGKYLRTPGEESPIKYGIISQDALIYNPNLSENPTEDLLARFADSSDVDEAYRGAVAVMAANGLFTGNEKNQLLAQKGLTRAEAAVVIDRLLAIK